MALRRVKISDIQPFDYSFGGAIRARMADVGRTVGSQSIGLTIQTVAPGCRSSRRHRHVFQEEILIVMQGNGTMLHDEQRIPVAPGDTFCYRPDDPELHSFENTGTDELVIWAFGNRFAHEVCLYPDEGVAFVEGLGAEVKLSDTVPSAWTEDRRKR